MCNKCEEKTFSRRALMLGGAGMLAAVPFCSFAQVPPTTAASTPDAALALLTEGNTRYAANEPRQRDFSASRGSLAMGQAPFAAILGCADSRIAPELAFDQNPGDLFVVRVAGNFVTSEGVGSLEYGAAVLGTKLIMVLGHTSCGAIQATISALQKGNKYPGEIAGLVRALKPGLESVMKTPGADLEQRAVIANVRYNMARLKKSKPVLSGLIAKKQLRIVGGIYDLATGKVTMV
jgi:carbonic anhydrase